MTTSKPTKRQRSLVRRKQRESRSVALTREFLDVIAAAWDYAMDYFDKSDAPISKDDEPDGAFGEFAHLIARRFFGRDDEDDSDDASPLRKLSESYESEDSEGDSDDETSEESVDMADVVSDEDDEEDDAPCMCADGCQCEEDECICADGCICDEVESEEEDDEEEEEEEEKKEEPKKKKSKVMITAQ